MRVRTFLVVALLSSTAFAERVFPFTWTSATQTKATTDAELWLTMRTGRLTPFDQLEVRGWVSAGVARNVDVHFGLETDFLLRRREQKELDGRISALARYRFFEPDEVLGVGYFDEPLLGFNLDRFTAFRADNPFVYWWFAFNATPHVAAMLWDGKEDRMVDYLLTAMVADPHSISAADKAEYVRGLRTPGGLHGSFGWYRDSLRTAQQTVEALSGRVLGVPLLAERTIAVDPRSIPLGAPVFLATTRPNSEVPLRRLVMAQDTGGAIKGVVRGDVFWGAGEQAEFIAGHMKSPGRWYALLPRSLAPTS